MMISKKQLLVLLIFLIAFSIHSFGDVIHLHVPKVSESPNQHLFYHELLLTAISQAGYSANIVVRELPHNRTKKYLEAGILSIMWMVASAERDSLYEPIRVGLTNGLIGTRILLIRNDMQPLFDQVQTLDDFRALNLTGAMGQDWFDVSVWELNDLKYLEQSGNWKAIFKKLHAKRDFDYFSRGVNEIIIEQNLFPDLSIEKRLLLIYDRDFRFYLSKKGKNAGVKYHSQLTLAFDKAKSSGLIDRLIRKYWAKDFETLDYDNRIKIFLKTPK